MSLAKRIIPTLLCRGRQLVKGSQFNSWRSVGLATQAVRIHQARNVDELVLLDIAATAEGRGPDLALVEELSDCCYMPLAVGGGIRTVQHIRDLLKAGADKVVIGSAAIEDPYLLKDAAQAVGRQAIVASIDYRQDTIGRVVYGRNGTKLTQFDPIWWALKCQGRGAGELLLTSIDREGTMQGYDIDLIRLVSKAVDIPVIAHGGAGSYEHMREAIEAGADAVAAGAMFQFTDQTPKGAATHLAERGVETRL